MKRLAIAVLMLSPTLALAQQPTPSEYILKVKPAQLDVIGKGLGRLPYEEVAELMQSLRQQVVEQQMKVNKPVEKEPEKN